jgi:hypothetical protein
LIHEAGSRFASFLLKCKVYRPLTASVGGYERRNAKSRVILTSAIDQPLGSALKSAVLEDFCNAAVIESKMCYSQ